MDAVDVLIAQLEQYTNSIQVQPVLAQISVLIAALQELQAGIIGPTEAQLIDPRAFGAKANGWIFGDGLINSGNLSQLILNSTTQMPRGAVPGAPISVGAHLFPQSTAPLYTGTIASVVRPNIINLAGPASAAGSNLGGFFGTDDSAAIAAAVDVAGYNYDDPQAVNAPYVSAIPGSQTAWGQLGTKTVVFTASGINALSDNSIYCVSSPVLMRSGMAFDWSPGSQIMALPNFTGDALMTNDLGPSTNPQQLLNTSVRNAVLNAMGVANYAFWLKNSLTFFADGNWQLRGGVNGGGRWGPGTNTYSGSVSGIMLNANFYIENVSSSDPAYVSVANATGWLWDIDSDDNFVSGNIFVNGYDQGYVDKGGDNVVGGIVHVNTDLKQGSMTVGFYFQGSNSYIEKAIADTPSAYSSAVSYGVRATGDAEIGSLSLVCNNSDTLVVDNTSIGVSDEINSTGTSRLLIHSCKATRSSSAKKWKQVFQSQLSTAPGATLQVNDFYGDNNWYTQGRVDWKQLRHKTAIINAQSTANLLLQSKQAIVGATSQLWTPEELGNNIMFWFDASMPNSLTLTPGGAGVMEWHSRLGNGIAIQDALASQPQYSAGGWTIGTGYQGVAGAVTFDGIAQFLSMLAGTDPVFPPFLYGPFAGTALYIFAVMIPQTQSDGTNRQVAVIGGNNWAADQQLSTGPSEMIYTGFGVGPSAHATFTAGAKTLSTGIFNGAASTSNATGRINGNASNIATSGLGASQNDLSTIGASYAAGVPANFCSMTIAEIIVVATSLTDGNVAGDQTRQFEGYLGWKWGIQATALPAGHPYTAAPPTA